MYVQHALCNGYDSPLDSRIAGEVMRLSADGLYLERFSTTTVLCTASIYYNTRNKQNNKKNKQWNKTNEKKVSLVTARECEIKFPIRVLLFAPV